jgi:hypothetical protein
MLKVNVESKVGTTRHLQFSRGIEESSLTSSPHWSTSTRVSLSLGPHKNQVLTMKWSFASPTQWIPYDRVQSSSWVTNKSSGVTTKLQLSPSRLGDVDHQEL